MPPGTSLLDQLRDFAASEGLTLPVVSPVATGLMSAVRNETVTAADVERVVQSDQALAAEVLRAANSAFYAGLSPVVTVQGAVFRLGLVQVARLVLMASEQNRYTARQPVLRNIMGGLWAHAVATAQAAEWLARRLGHRDSEQEAFVGGLLHDIGKLFLVRVLDEMVSRSSEPFDTPEAFLLELLDVAHTDQGHRLVCEWNLPEIYGTIVRDHHVPDPDQTNIALLIVRLANRACDKAGIGAKHDPSIVLAVLPEAAMLMTGEVLLAELEVLLEDLGAELSAQRPS
jgi:putative nucleotidyltransferase with HDIG domain